jgi:hypothetical protein
MQIDKETILNLLRERGQPDQVDSERDSGLLEKYGVNPQDLLGKLGGGGQGIPGL